MHSQYEEDCKYCINKNCGNSSYNKYSEKLYVETNGLYPRTPPILGIGRIDDSGFTFSCDSFICEITEKTNTQDIYDFLNRKNKNYDFDEWFKKRKNPFISHLI